MSIRLMNKAWEWDGLNPTEKLILLCLADHANDDGECWPSQSRIAERAGITDRYVRGVLTRLEKRGLLEKSRRKHASNLYRLTLDDNVSLPLNQDRNHSSGQDDQDRNSDPQDRNHSSGQTGTPVPTNHHEPPLLEPGAKAQEKIPKARFDEIRPDFMRKAKP